MATAFLISFASFSICILTWIIVLGHDWSSKWLRFGALTACFLSTSIVVWLAVLSVL